MNTRLQPQAEEDLADDEAEQLAREMHEAQIATEQRDAEQRDAEQRAADQREAEQREAEPLSGRRMARAPRDSIADSVEDSPARSARRCASIGFIGGSAHVPSL